MIPDAAIRHNGQDYPAAQCPHCPVKVHPPEALALHLQMHKLKSMRLKSIKRELIEMFKPMRSNW